MILTALSVLTTGLLIGLQSPGDAVADRAGQQANIGSAQTAKDLRFELPRDLRIALLGVPSVKSAKKAEESLSSALNEYEKDRTANDVAATRLEQDKARVYFRLGRFDQALAALIQSLLDQDRIKGLEDYQKLARELQIRSESMGGYGGDSMMATVDEGDEPPRPAPGARDADFAKQLKRDLTQLDDTLHKIEGRARPDEERKVQLEKEAGAVGQFVMQLKTLADEVKTSKETDKEIKIDGSELIQGVQNLIEVIRDIKEQRDSTDPRDPRQPKELRRQRKHRSADGL